MQDLGVLSALWKSRGWVEMISHRPLSLERMTAMPFTFELGAEVRPPAGDGVTGRAEISETSGFLTRHDRDVSGESGEFYFLEVLTIAVTAASVRQSTGIHTALMPQSCAPSEPLSV
jgi:hypothetical protein